MGLIGVPVLNGNRIGIVIAPYSLREKALAEAVVRHDPEVEIKEAVRAVGIYVTSPQVQHLKIEEKWALFERLLLQVEIKSRLTYTDSNWKATRFEVEVNKVIELVGFVGESGSILFMDRDGVLYYGDWESQLESQMISSYFAFDQKRNTNYVSRFVGTRTRIEILNYFYKQIEPTRYLPKKQ